jgi:XTP/dITP diphosphohydrolase/tetrapyrrole methylase family protein/MazG family protein/ATP diphosphatase
VEGVGAGEPAAALQRLDQITRLLRTECPWDREQDERSIVPHTVEEAYELADAAHSGDDAKLLDELGDVLFQVHFLSLLLEERGAGDLAAVADHCRNKLIRRHPHVFADVEVEDAAEVLRNWDDIKRGEAGREAGPFGDVPQTLPGPLYARKLLRRADSAGREWPPEGARARLESAVAAALEAAPAVGDLLFAAVALARELRVDPELALRAAADRFRDEMEGGTG